MKLYVGCGGMAIRTLVRLREKLAGGPLDRDISTAFLAVDSDGSALERFERDIRSSNGRPLICKTLKLIGAVSDVNEIVGRAVGSWQDGGDLRKLSQYWWFAPANGTGIKSSTACPTMGRALGTETPQNWSAATAYLATWHSLPRLDSLVRDIVREGASRFDSGLEQRWSVWIVSSLAGETSRGCWALTAMKIRQCFREFGINVCPRGVFLDASCYGSLGAISPDFADRIRLNSLLASSELSAWLKMGWDESEYECSLPSLMHPEDANDPGAILAPTSNAGRQNAPVIEAFVVSKGTGVTPSPDIQECPEMVASALYAWLIDVDIESRCLNRICQVSNLSAASFVIDKLYLQSFADHMARLTCVEQLCEYGKWDAGNVRMSSLRSCWHVALDGIRQGVVNGSDDCLAVFEGMAQIMLTQRTANAVVIGNGLWQSLATPNCNVAFISSIIKAFLADVGLEDEDIAKSVTREIWQAFAPEGEMPSFERVRAYAKEMASVLDQTIAAILSESGTLVSAVSQTAVADAFVKGPYQAAQKGNGFLAGLIRPTFPRRNVEMLRKQYVDSLCASIALAVRSSVMPKLEQMRDELRRQCLSLDGLLQMLKRALDDLERQGERFKAIFADPDACMDRGTVPGVWAVSPFKRVLTPIVSREAMKDISLRMLVEHGVNAWRLRDFGQKSFSRVLRADEDDLVGLAREFSRIVEDSVPPVNLDEIGFSFMPMLKRNLGVWNGLLAESKGDVRVHERRKSLLCRHLGVRESDFNMDTQGMLNVEMVFKGIVVSTCSLCSRVSDSGKGVEDMSTVGAVLVPTNLDDGLRMRIEKGLHDERLRDFSIDDIEGNGHLIESPDGVIACLSVGSCNLKGSLSDAVPSLNCWRSPKLLPLLRMAEDPDGAAYFEKSAVSGRYVERRYAVGYVSPIFVRHPEMSKGRWRPWWTQNLGENRVRGSRRAEPRPYDVFISYRRDGGVDPARMLALKLEGPDYGYKVFFDQDSIRQGVFNQAIFKAIDECKYFVLVVTEGSFDRCAEEDDWVRQEVERALKAGKTIVPVAPYPEKACAFPKDLPPSMAGLANLQIAELNMRQLFDVSVRQMVGARFV